MERKAKIGTTKNFAIGIDLGATTIKTGVVDKRGRMLDHFSLETKANKGPNVVLQQMVFAIRELFSRYDQENCWGIGIGSPGNVNIEEQVVRYPPNFTDWAGVAVGKAIRGVYDLPVFIENDANCAAIGESRWGGGSEFSDFLFVIWGTGIGGGIILNRKIHRGVFGGAGEIGHISIDYNGPDCNCGGRGCVESYIGQRYLSQRTKQILEHDPEHRSHSRLSRLVKGNLNNIDPFHISKAAEEGDKVAREIMIEAGKFLGYALASALNVLDLHTVVIGGGVSAAPQFVFDAVYETVHGRVLKTHQNNLKVLRAQLGNNAGVIGAASLVI